VLAEAERRGPVSMRPRRANAIADTLASRLIDRSLPLYRNAISDYIDGNPNSEAWEQIAQMLTRQLVAASLLGRAAAVRAMVSQGLLPAPKQEPIVALPMVAEFDDDDDIAEQTLRQTIRQIVNQFTDEVPDLATVAPRVIEQASVRARGIVFASQEDSPRLVQSILRKIPQSKATVPDTLPDPARVVRELLANDEGAAVIRSALDTEVRTSLMTGFNQGTRAENVKHKNIMPVTVLDEIQDRRTRGNPNGLYADAGMHYQMDGFTAATDDPIWDRITPPNGYNCRATHRGMSAAKARQNKYLREDGSVDREALRRKFARQWSIIERGLYPDPGF
jgi:hypothetical protein